MKSTLPHVLLSLTLFSTGLYPDRVIAADDPAAAKEKAPTPAATQATPAPAAKPGPASTPKAQEKDAGGDKGQHAKQTDAEKDAGNRKEAGQNGSNPTSKPILSKPADDDESKPIEQPLGKATPFHKDQKGADDGKQAKSSVASKTMKATPAEDEKPRSLTLGKATPFGKLEAGAKSDEPVKPKTSLFKAVSEPERAQIKLGKAKPFGHLESNGDVPPDEKKEKPEGGNQSTKEKASEAATHLSAAKVDTKSPSPMTVSAKEDEPDDIVRKISFAERKAEAPKPSLTKPITFKRVETEDAEPPAAQPQEEKPAAEPPAKNDKPSADAGEMPRHEGELRGPMPVRVNNPNDFKVTVGLRSGGKGRDFEVSANGTKTVNVPNGAYEVFFKYSNDPDGLYKGDLFALRGTGVEISIVKHVGGNFAIHKVRLSCERDPA